MGLLNLFKKDTGNKDLDSLVNRVRMNMANNYKDAAQEDYKKFVDLLTKLEESGALTEKQLVNYKQINDEFGQRLKKYTHKDQKPNW